MFEQNKLTDDCFKQDTQSFVSTNYSAYPITVISTKTLKLSSFDV